MAEIKFRGGSHCCYGGPCFNCTPSNKVPKRFRATFGAGFTDGTCTNCAALNGASITLVQDPLLTCDWVLTFSPGDGSCSMTADLKRNGSSWFFTLVVGATTYTWRTITFGPQDCRVSGLSLAFFSGAGGECGGTPGAVTFTAL